jgi:hypothetical protein
MKFDPVFPPYVKDDGLSGHILGGQWPAWLALAVIATAVWLYFR